MIICAGIIAIITAFFLAFLATPLAAKVAERFGMIDLPRGHKAHDRPTPLLGGCAIFAAILGPSLLAMALVRIWSENGAPDWMPKEFSVHIAGAASKAMQGLGILAGALVLHVMGIIDDRRPLGPTIKLTVQLAVSAFVAIFLDVRVLNGNPPGAAISCIVSIIWLTAVINSFNFLDNMDGLSAGVAAICAAALLGAAASIGQIFVSAWLCLLLGALVGFLVYNFPPAKIFMGDAGSLVIGYMLGVLTCLTTYVGPGLHYYGALVPLVLLAVPLYDTASVIIIRLRERRNPMVGDRRHFSHRLVKRGMSVRSAVLTIYMCTVATAVAATFLPRADMFSAILIFVQTIAILLVIALMESGEVKP